MYQLEGFANLRLVQNELNLNVQAYQDDFTVNCTRTTGVSAFSFDTCVVELSLGTILPIEELFDQAGQASVSNDNYDNFVPPMLIVKGKAEVKQHTVMFSSLMPILEEDFVIMVALPYNNTALHTAGTRNAKPQGHDAVFVWLIPLIMVLVILASWCCACQYMRDCGKTDKHVLWYRKSQA